MKAILIAIILSTTPSFAGVAGISSIPGCQNMMSACTSGGYIVGQWKKDNGAFDDCLYAGLAGLPNPRGVQFNQSDVDSCKAAMALGQAPCASIMTACEAAGFQPVQAEDGTGLRLGCFVPTMMGTSVSGVTINPPSNIQSCQSQVNTEEPCEAIAIQCESAGYDPHKGMAEKCRKPLLNGGTVSNVTVSADVIAACQAKRAAKTPNSSASGTPTPAATGSGSGSSNSSGGA